MSHAILVLTIHIDVSLLRKRRAKVVGHHTLVTAGHGVLHVSEVEVGGVALDIALAAGSDYSQGVIQQLPGKTTTILHSITQAPPYN